MEATVVFSQAIQYMKNHLFKNLLKDNTNITEKDILWVITVPAIWEDSAMLFMRTAAEKV